MNTKNNVIPILLGADLNAYSTARAFHEYSGVISHSFGRYRCGLVGFSKIVKAHTLEGLDDIKVAGPALFDFAKQHKGKRLLLIPCADWYIELAARISKRLPELYVSLVPSDDVRKRIGDKISFYEILREKKIPFPEYIPIYKGDTYKAKAEKMSYPAVLKPADSTEYWKHEFHGMQKVYFPATSDEAIEIIEKIFKSGYDKGLVLQRKIGDDQPKMSVFTTYSDRSGRVVRGVYGNVILEETGRTSHGNHAAIITEPMSPLCKRIIELLDSMEYSGIANFDIISDGEKELVLEVNMRQGRSCDYLRAAGVNIAELMTSDLNGEKIKKKLEYAKIYWHYPPHYLVIKKAADNNSIEAERMRKEGGSCAPLYYEADFRANPLRRAYVAYHDRRLVKGFSRR